MRPCPDDVRPPAAGQTAATPPQPARAYGSWTRRHAAGNTTKIAATLTGTSVPSATPVSLEPADNGDAQRQVDERSDDAADREEAVPTGALETVARGRIADAHDDRHARSCTTIALPAKSGPTHA